jgi:hypothetical protein
MAHLRPAVYPGDMSIFTGRTTVEKMHFHNDTGTLER